MEPDAVGDIYENYLETGDTTPYRAERGSLWMFYLRIRIEKCTVYIGRQGKQSYPLAKDNEYELWNVDLADLYFRNSADSGKVYLIGTTRR